MIGVLVRLVVIQIGHDQVERAAGANVLEIGSREKARMMTRYTRKNGE